MAIEAPEGIVFSSQLSGGVNNIDTRDLLGTTYTETEIRGLSKSQIETMDLLSEGRINNLVSGIWVFSGTLGNVGWTTGTFSGFNFPSSLTGAAFLRSVYWNEVPVLNDNGLLNFQSINVKTSIGEPNGGVLQVLSPFQTVSRTIGERLRAGSTSARYYRILNKDCRGVVTNIRIPQLVKTNDANGNIERTEVSYSIDYRPLFTNKLSPEYISGRNERIFGKVTSAYIRTTRVDFISNFLDDPAFYGWEIRIERSTPESTTTFLQNQTYVDSLTEIQGNVYTFPNSAMVRSLFDAEFFQSIPERAYETELLKVKIPGNYNPTLKTYATSGFAITNSGWNGEFATGVHWTDNPAWCYYDLLTNKRYGLGKYIDSDLVDKTSLYDIGKYCDTLVSDGQGGLEPRFTCNTWITTREEAYKVVNDFASIFRGLTYYANGSIFAVQDSPKTPIVTFTNTNVEEGNFNYSTSSKRARYSIAIVRYNDPKNFYKPAIEYVEDFDAIRKYGIREIELTAFGCTSRGQAIRLGRWVLLSENLESEQIKFIGGLECNYLKPGDVFKVHDTHRKTKRYGGRVSAFKNVGTTPITGNVVLDNPIDLEPNVEYKISFLTPSYNYDPTQVSGLSSNDSANIRRSFIQEFTFSGFQSQISGSKMVIDIYSGFDFNNYVMSGNPVWMVELSDRYSNYTGNKYFANQSFDYYRTINIIEKDIHKYEIEGLQYNSQKYSEIESGLLFQRNVLNQNKIPSSPYNLNFNISNITENLKTINYSFLSDDITNTDTFKVYSKIDDFNGNGVPDSQYLLETLPSYTTNGNLNALSSGNYYFRIYASNDVQGILSPSFASGMVTIYDFESIREVNISSFDVSAQSDEDTFGIIYSGNSETNYPTIIRTNDDDSPIFKWQVGFNNSVLSQESLFYRITVRPYSDDNSRIPNSGIVYEVTGLTSPTWQFNIEDNIDSLGGPYRNYQVVVEAHNASGKTSAGNTIGNYVENQWNIYPNGYDILGIRNPIPSGAEFADNVTSEDWGIITTSGSNDDYGLITEVVTFTGNYGLLTDTTEFISNGYIGPNGDIVINNFFDPEFAGGYIYTSTGEFDIAQTGLITGVNEGRIRKSLFYYDVTNPYIYHPTAAFNLKNLTSGFVSISFFDELDKALIANSIDISTGLYVSQNTVLFNDSYVGRLTLGDGTNNNAQTVKQVRMAANSDFGIDWNTNVMLFSGTISGMTSVIYANVAEGSTINWRE